MMVRRVLGMTAVIGAMTAGTLVAQARPAARAAAPTKVGFVNFRAVVAQVPGFATAESTFVKANENTQKLLQVLNDSAEAARVDFEARSATLPPAQADAQRKGLVAKGQAWAARADTLQQQLRVTYQSLLAPIEQRAFTALEAVRKEAGYAMILDASAENSPIIAADSTADVTARVVTKVKSTPRP